MCISLSTCIHVFVYICVYIYIEERVKCVYTYVYICITHVYIIYAHV